MRCCVSRLVAMSALFSGAIAGSANAIEIVVDYSLDTNNFFNTQQKRDAMQAAADRFSRVITSPLAAVSPSGTGTGTSAGWRIGATHPGMGGALQISTASSVGTDPLSVAGEADVYGFDGLNSDEWILYAGGRSLGSAGVGGTGTGTNFTSTFNDVNGPMHRGFNDNTPSDSVSDLPRWGGSISFDTGRTWHFDLDTIAPFGSVDFYSIALHEVGHALGLSTSWNQWQDDGSGNYTGSEAIAAYNVDNAATRSSLDLQSSTNRHWEDGAYESYVFAAGDPITVGTVPTGTRQDLLMEPTANFSSLQERFELTNVDVAALEDLGWSVLSTLGDIDGDGNVDAADINLLYANLGSTDPTYDLDMDRGQADQADVDTLVEDILMTSYGDANLDGSLTSADFTLLQSNFSGPGGWAEGDFNGDATVSIADFALLQSNFGGAPAAASAAVEAVPEPATLLLAMTGLLGMAVVVVRTGRSRSLASKQW